MVAIGTPLEHIAGALWTSADFHGLGPSRTHADLQGMGYPDHAPWSSWWPWGRPAGSTRLDEAPGKRLVQRRRARWSAVLPSRREVASSQVVQRGVSQIPRCREIAGSAGETRLTRNEGVPGSSPGVGFCRFAGILCPGQ